MYTSKYYMTRGSVKNPRYTVNTVHTRRTGGSVYTRTVAGTVFAGTGAVWPQRPAGSPVLNPSHIISREPLSFGLGILGWMALYVHANRVRMELEIIVHMVLVVNDGALKLSLVVVQLGPLQRDLEAKVLPENGNETPGKINVYMCSLDYLNEVEEDQGNICPDFMGARYQATRTAMVSPTITEVQAAETLRTTWVLTNEDLCLQWREQVAEDEPFQLEESTARADEKKKNRSKHSAIIMRPRPFANDEEALVSEFALRKIDSGKYVELYYWTNQGLDDALTNYRTRDDDSMVPSIGEDGSTVWVSAATSKPAAGVIADRDLSPVDFAQAIPRIMAAIEERDWTKQRTLMLAQFWGAIMMHRYWNSNDLLASRAILLYQEEQRRAWHSAILSSNGAWDISIIDEPTLVRTFERVYRASLIRTTNIPPEATFQPLLEAIKAFSFSAS
ncbi:uncharacterized protein HD556DRAFT_1306508 [Suillus plorans]|uniref:Uncharacterized protein n=1 Tax=Suillus plorans TaxID=116603 RepID=A0A9P7DKT8_9AGAM|nr:uncharacterized protein HD556DRAFT_1306508 [Suillus plorans]KAG1797340.1 hypothetical protein HD556DRAFT_1306508 [Suillus plorans]